MKIMELSKSLLMKWFICSAEQMKIRADFTCRHMLIIDKIKSLRTFFFLSLL